MGLIFWWLLLIWLGAIVGYWVVRYFILKRRKKRQALTTAIPIAHSDRLTGLAEYKEALKQYELLMRVAVGVVTLALLLSIVLSARPASITLITPAQQSRDIMMCLDVSGSVLRADAALVNRFNLLVNSFSGQRFGLSVFNSSSVAVIPLSDDYQFITQRLKIVGDALAAQEGKDFEDLTSGTLAEFDKGTSLVTDGLVSCINNLGDNPLKRSQSIILATDNESNGTPIINEEQAKGLAANRNIRIYTIDPGESEKGKRTEDHTKLKSLAEQSGGGHYVLSDANAINSIIDDISGQEARYAASTPVVAVSDIPKPFTYAAYILTAATIGIIWRLRL